MIYCNHYKLKQLSYFIDSAPILEPFFRSSFGILIFMIFNIYMLSVHNFIVLIIMPILLKLFIVTSITCWIFSTTASISKPLQSLVFPKSQLLFLEWVQILPQSLSTSIPPSVMHPISTLTSNTMSWGSLRLLLVIRKELRITNGRIKRTLILLKYIDKMI